MAGNIQLPLKQQIPLVQHTFKLQAALGEWANAVDAKRLERITEGERELHEARTEARRIDATLSDLRRRLVVEDLPRGKLAATRKSLRDKFELIDDLETGLKHARSEKPIGNAVKGISIQPNVAALRDARAEVLGAAAGGRLPVHGTEVSIQANVGALRAKLAAIDAVVSPLGQADAVIAELNSIRRAVDSIENEMKKPMKVAA